MFGLVYSAVLILRAHARIRSLSAAVSFGLMPYGWNRLSGRRSIAASAAMTTSTACVMSDSALPSAKGRYRRTGVQEAAGLNCVPTRQRETERPGPI
jgi:hypothetical protein